MLAPRLEESVPRVVVGPTSGGYLVGSLAAVHLRVGFAAVVKDPSASMDSESQLLALKRPVELGGAWWLGASVAVDMFGQNTVWRDLHLRSVFNGREL